jgi:serine protease AprX
LEVKSMRYSIVGATLEQVKGAGGKDIREAPGTGIIFAELDEAGVALLKSLGAGVKKVGEVKPGDITPPAPIPGENGSSPLDLMAAIGFTEEWRGIIEPPLYGEGFGIAILDSGVRETHELIKGRVVYSRNFTASPGGDRFNHGTGVASLVTAIAPRCDLIDIKVIDDSGVGTDEGVVLGISEVISLKQTRADIFPYVINLSLGKEDDGDPLDPLRVACRAAIEKGIFVFAAAGNLGPQMGTIMSPACERYVSAIGSITYNPQDPERSFRVSSFSSRGPTREGLVKPDAVLPGENIIMADSRSDTATVVKSGTSFATPFASAMTLLHGEGAMKQARRVEEYQLPGLPVTWVPMTPVELLDKWTPLITVKPAGAPRGKDVEYGWGIPFGELAALALTGGLPSQAAASVIDMVVPIAGIGILGMMMGSVAKVMRYEKANLG